ncbi:MAG: hypothetical protein ACR2MO_12980 [Acidimicrobiales bacterium]
MPSGTAAGVFVLRHDTALPAPPPPGLTVVPAAGAAAAEGTGAAIAGMLGADGFVTVDDALAALARRRAQAAAGPSEHLRTCATSAADARAAVEKGRLGLSTVPAGLSAVTVRSALYAVAEAVEAVHAAREAVGSRPGYDDEAATAARAAQAEVEQARVDRAGALPKANRVLTMANVGAGLLVLGRLASEAFDGAFLLVAVLPTAAVGYAVHAVIAPARRARAAARRRWAALRSMNVSTLAGLAALEERAGAWERRAARLTEAEAELRVAREVWRSLVGGAVAFASAGRLANDLDAFATLERAAEGAARAWAGAAVALQAAEDAVPAGHPVVVLDPDPDAADEVRSAAVRSLADLAGATTVVLVVAEPVPVVPAVEEPDDVEEMQDEAPSWPAPALVPQPVPPPPVPIAAAPADSGIVDLRERVRAGLQRLRARSGPPHDRPEPGSVAAEG